MDVSDIFNFFLLGGGEGGVRGTRKGRGVGFFLKIPGGGGGLAAEGGGVEGPGGCLCGMWGGGLNIFFRGRNSHKLVS